MSLDPEAWSQGDDRLAIEVNAKALAAMGYQPSDVARIASAAFDPTERARLYAVAASSTKELSQRLTWVADITRSSYEAAHFQDAIRSAKFLATAAEMELPPHDPKAVSLQKAAQEVQGWAYLRTGDREMFDEFASSYATKYTVLKELFNEPTSTLASKPDWENFLVWFNAQSGSRMIQMEMPKPR